MRRLSVAEVAADLAFRKIIDPKTDELLIPVLAVNTLSQYMDGMSATRMQNSADIKAVELTLKQRVAAFWSRSNCGLWTKGATSGNVLNPFEAYTECDNDVVLLDVQAIGQTCHNGNRSCFETKGIGE